MFDLEKFLPYRLFALSEAIGRDFREVYKKRAGLNRPEWRVLATLGTGAGFTATELGQATGMHKTKISRAVRALENRRWITRVRRARDRRYEDIELARAGQQAYGDLASQAHDFDARVWQALTPEERREVERALAVLERVILRA
jgi:DNA-binding MarR family transcriptional regulator